MTTIPIPNAKTFMGQRPAITDADALWSPGGTWSLPKLAARLSARPYLTMFERLCDGSDVSTRAWHPEFTVEAIHCCAAVGRTEAEASQRLEETRYLLILALLRADLPVPDPIRDTTPYVFPEIGRAES